MNMNHLGEILHQLGHALGMLDEQRRPDATRTYHLHGPHLQVFWQNIPTNWKVVFQPNEAAYTGSLNDGVGDAFDGYAPYDFESIMHISPWLYGMQVYETLPASKMGSVGQRKNPSQGDILQLLDSYRCRRQVSTTTTTTTTTQMASSTTTTTSTTVAQRCIQNPDCAVNPWCNDPSYQAWCPLHHSPCPAPYCMYSGG
ncbi:nas-13 [Symbiodinium pilosum]|uniref:Nas-13 protein n=1 Tax=Symbiodinium pilosum TaxID=2952 RepID=A0A812JGC7_SYMPI|nr:nas-13 [Symbiodinium pilosum]